MRVRFRWSSLRPGLQEPALPAETSSVHSAKLRRRKALLPLLLLAGTASVALGQQSLVPVPPLLPAAQLTPFQQQILLAFSPAGLLFKGLTLSGTVDRKVGSLSESGTVKLQSASDGSSSEEWTGAGDNRVIQETAFTGDRTCTIATKSTAAKDVDGIECQRVVPWFAPWNGLSVLSAALATGKETPGDAGNTLLTFAPDYGSLASLPVKRQQRLLKLAQAAAVDVLYDSATALPSGLHYTQPLSSESTNVIDVSVVYSDYRLELGFMVPHHIQRYVQRTLESDIHITNVVLN